MRVSVITVGINQWEEYTRPLIASIHKYEPGVDLVVVDNCSKEPYPEGDYELVRTSETCGYAQAINIGLAVVPLSRWYIILNNDVLCEGPFIKHLEKMYIGILWGNQLNHASIFGHYVEGWLYALSTDVYLRVGKFDEKFKYAAFEDVDYSYRAKEYDIPVVKCDLPFKHLKAETRFTMPAYREVYLENRRYLHRKHNV